MDECAQVSKCGFTLNLNKLDLQDATTGIAHCPRCESSAEVTEGDDTCKNGPKSRTVNGRAYTNALGAVSRAT